MNMTPKAALQHTKTLLLDMDGTLLDLAFDNYMWLEHIPRCYAVENALSLDAAKDHLYECFAAAKGSLDWYCLDHWCEQLGLDVVQIHHNMSYRIGYLPGARQFLQAMLASDIRIVLATNAHPDTLALKDAVTGLGDYFDAMYSSHEFGHAKESEAFWAAFHDTVGFDPATTMFIDDGAHVLQSAKGFGIAMPVLITRPDTRQAARNNTAFSGVEAVADLL